MTSYNEAFPVLADAPKERVRDWARLIENASQAIPASTADLSDSVNRRYVTDAQAAMLAAGSVSAAYVYATKAALDANTTAAIGARAEVLSDTEALNGVYQRAAGGWVRMQASPYVALDTRVDDLEASSTTKRDAPPQAERGQDTILFNSGWQAIVSVSSSGRVRFYGGVEGAIQDPDQGARPYVTAGGDLCVSGRATAMISAGGAEPWVAAHIDSGAIVATRLRAAFHPATTYRISRVAPAVGFIDDAQARSLWISDGQSHDPGSNTGLLESPNAQKWTSPAVAISYAFARADYPAHIEMLQFTGPDATFRNDVRGGWSGVGAVPKSTTSAWVALNPANIIGIEPARAVTTLPGSQYGLTPIEATAWHAVDRMMTDCGVAPHLAIASTGVGGASVAGLSSMSIDKRTVLEGFKTRYAALGRRVRPSLHFWRHGQNESFTGASYRADFEAYVAQINAIYADVFPTFPAPKWLGPVHMYDRAAGYESELALLEMDRAGAFAVTTPLYGIMWMGGHEWGDAYMDATFPPDWLHSRPWGVAALGALDAESALSIEAGLTPIKAPRFIIESRVGNTINLLYSDLDDVEVNTTLIGDPGGRGFVVTGGATVTSVARTGAKRLAVACGSIPSGHLEYALQPQTSPASKNGIPRGCVMDTRRVTMRDGTAIPRCATHQREAIP